jgi:hypothetical protein
MRPSLIAACVLCSAVVLGVALAGVPIKQAESAVLGQLLPARCSCARSSLIVRRCAGSPRQRCGDGENGQVGQRRPAQEVIRRFRLNFTFLPVVFWFLCLCMRSL